MICERLSLPRVNKKIKGYIQVTQERFSYLHFILLINEDFLPYFFLLTQTAAYARGITGDGVRNIGHIQIYVSSEHSIGTSVSASLRIHHIQLYFIAIIYIFVSP